MLSEFIRVFNERYPLNTKQVYHLIESNGTGVNELFLWFITNMPTAYIFQKKVNNIQYIFIAI